MPDTAIGLRIPQACIRCGARGTVRLQTALQGSIVTLEWLCTACNADWPVKRQEEVPHPKAS